MDREPLGEVLFWNGNSGGSFNIISIDESKNVFAVERDNNMETFVIIANLGSNKAEFKLDNRFSGRKFYDIYTDEEFDLTKTIRLKGYKYKILMENF